MSKILQDLLNIIEHEKTITLSKVVEASNLNNYISLCNDIAIFLTLNTSKLNSYGKDNDGTKQLTDMMIQFKKPVINGKNFIELHNEPNTLKNPKIIPHILKWVYGLLNYVKPRIDKYANDKGKQIFGERIKTLSVLYTAAVKDLT